MNVWIFPQVVPNCSRRRLCNPDYASDIQPTSVLGLLPPDTRRTANALGKPGSSYGRCLTWPGRQEVESRWGDACG